MTSPKQTTLFSRAPLTRVEERKGERIARADLATRVAFVLSLVAIGYAFLAGLRTLTVTDLGWQLATARWIVQHHEIPSTDVFSYTAQGQPWVYPVGSGLLFYGAYLLGGYTLLSWIQAAACAGTVALMVGRGSIVSAVLAILAVPMIAIRTGARADMFSVVLFAAFLVLLWQQHQSGRARLWLLPILMITWVNLHLGFVAGLALVAAYVLVEALDMVWPERRVTAAGRLGSCWPWLIVTCLATLVNPWGWGIFAAVLRQTSAMDTLTLWTSEWGSASLNWTVMSLGLSLRNPTGAFYLMLLIAAVAVPVAFFRREFGAVALISGAAVIAVRHIRFEALFGIVTVVVAGAVLSSAFSRFSQKEELSVRSIRCSSGLTIGVALLAVILAWVRSADLVSDRRYLASGDELGSFGTGLSWWFPERAAAFIERENIPGHIFNSYNDGGYFIWRLGAKYPDYIDGRTIPFGPKLIERSVILMRSLPDSSAWQREAQDRDINTIFVPLGRNNGLHLFPVLRQFCASDTWRPVYLDEVSAVFMRRAPENQGLIARLQIECATTLLPAIIPQGNSTEAFNRWANAAAVLRVLGRDSEAFEATKRALGIFPDSAFVHFLRGNLLEEASKFDEAEKEYLLSVKLEPNGTTWSRLGVVYHREDRLMEEIDAWEHASELLPYPAIVLLPLGYADLAAHRPQMALQAFDKVVAGLPPYGGDAFLADVAHGRAAAWDALGDLQRAVSLAEETVRLRPLSSEDWLILANLYDREQRFEDGQRARERAATVSPRQTLPIGPQLQH
jgi:tetratricopeptide (TPR) repeat protein